MSRVCFALAVLLCAALCICAQVPLSPVKPVPPSPSVDGLSLTAPQTILPNQEAAVIVATCAGVVEWEWQAASGKPLTVTKAASGKTIVVFPSGPDVITFSCWGVIDGKPTKKASTSLTISGGDKTEAPAAVVPPINVTPPAPPPRKTEIVNIPAGIEIPKGPPNFSVLTLPKRYDGMTSIAMPTENRTSEGKIVPFTVEEWEYMDKLRSLADKNRKHATFVLPIVVPPGLSAVTTDTFKFRLSDAKVNWHIRQGAKIEPAFQQAVAQVGGMPAVIVSDADGTFLMAQSKGALKNADEAFKVLGIQ